MVLDIEMSYLGGPGTFWTLDAEDRADIVAYWNVRHGQKAEKMRASRSNPHLSAVDLRNVLTAPASIGDLWQLFMAYIDAHTPKDRRGKSGKGAFLAEGKSRGENSAGASYWAQFIAEG